MQRAWVVAAVAVCLPLMGCDNSSDRMSLTAEVLRADPGQCVTTRLAVTYQGPNQVSFSSDQHRFEVTSVPAGFSATLDVVTHTLTVCNVAGVRSWTTVRWRATNLSHQGFTVEETIWVISDGDCATPALRSAPDRQTRAVCIRPANPDVAAGESVTLEVLNLDRGPSGEWIAAAHDVSFTEGGTLTPYEGLSTSGKLGDGNAIISSMVLSAAAAARPARVDMHLGSPAGADPYVTADWVDARVTRITVRESDAGPDGGLDGGPSDGGWSDGGLDGGATQDAGPFDAGAGSDAGADAGSSQDAGPRSTWARIYPPPPTASGPDSGTPPDDLLDGRLLRATSGGFVAIVDAPPQSTAPQTPVVVALDPSGVFVWARHYGFDPASITDVVEIGDAGFAVLGTVSGAPGVGFARVVRTDPSGAVLWEKQLDSASPHTPPAIEALPAGGFLVLLRTLNGGALAAVVVRLDAAGNVSWAKRQGSTGLEHHPSSLHRTSDDGVLISGVRGVLGAGEGWVAKLDAAGDMVWQRAFSGGFGVSMHDAIEAADGGYLAVGEVVLRRGTISPPVPGTQGPLLMRLDATGAPVWQKTYANATPSIAPVRMRAVELADRYVVLVNEPAPALLAVDGAGTVLWEKAYASSTVGSRLASVQASPGGLAVSGTTAQRAWLLRLDSDGNVGASCPATIAANVAGITATNATVTTSAPAVSTSIVTFGSTVTSSPGAAGPTSTAELVCGM